MVSPSATPSGRKRLLVAAERHIVRLIQVNLERQGHEVTCTYDGDEAIRQIELACDEDGRRLDMVVLAPMLPKRSGAEVLAWIRSNPRTHDLDVIILGTHEDGGPGSGPYLKPFNPMDVFRRR